jgi:two-component system LytT family response regulator
MSTPIRTLVVDDEPLAREGIRLRLRGDSGFVVVGECGDGAQALETIAEMRPDVVFLDVQMPGLTGFDVVDELGDEAPAVVFVTAYDQYALRAFEVHALDYVLKPFDDERFTETLRRVRVRLAERRAGRLEERLAGLLGDLRMGGAEGAPRHYPRRLAVRDAAKIAFVDVDQLDWVEADGDYVRLHCGAASHMVRRTMAQLETRLDPDRFVRIHRSTIVSVDRVRELRPTFHGEYVVVLKDGTRLKLSRGYRPRVQQLLDAAL